MFLELLETLCTVKLNNKDRQKKKSYNWSLLTEWSLLACSNL